jgi:hypothetical protein
VGKTRQLKLSGKKYENGAHKLQLKKSLVPQHAGFELGHVVRDRLDERKSTRGLGGVLLVPESLADKGRVLGPERVPKRASGFIYIFVYLKK